MVFLISLSLVNAAAELASDPLPNVVGMAIKEAFFLNFKSCMPSSNLPRL